MLSVTNRSQRTRVSIDFRCVPGNLYEPTGRLSRQGYYSLVERVADVWHVTERGRLSRLHGLPHVAKPTIDP